MNEKARTFLEAFSDLPIGSTVVEIGCARFGHEIPSDGWSTVHLARAAEEHGWTFHSVDIDPAAVATARDATFGLPVIVHEGDGAEWLRAFEGFIDGLYLDGSADPHEAVAQYEAADGYSPAPIIVIDDVQAIDGVERGKGNALLDRLEADGYTVEIKDTEPGYRMAVARARS